MQSLRIFSSKKAQVSLDYLLLLIFLLLIIVPIAFFSFNVVGTDVKITQAQTTADTITSLMSSLAKAPPGSVKCIKINIPEGILSATIAARDLVIHFEDRNTINSISSRAEGGLFYYSLVPLTSPGITEICIANSYDDGIHRTNDLGVIYIGGNLPTPASDNACQIITPYLTGTEDPDCDITNLYDTHLNTGAAFGFQREQPACGNLALEQGEECEKKEDCYDGRYGWICMACQCWAINDVSSVPIGSSDPPEDPGGPPPPTPPVCGDGIVETPEQCEQDPDCDTGEVCDSSCNCVAPPPPDPVCKEFAGAYPYLELPCCSETLDCPGQSSIYGDFACSLTSSVCQSQGPGGCGTCIPATILLYDGAIPGTTNVKNNDDISITSSHMSGQLAQTLDEGDSSLSFTPKPHFQTAILYLIKPSSIIGMTILEFDIKSGKPGDSPVYLTLNLEDGTSSPQVNINSYIPGGLSHREYKTTQVPLSEFAIDTDTAVLSSIEFEGEPNSDLFFDNVQLKVS